MFIGMDFFTNVLNSLKKFDFLFYTKESGTLSKPLKVTNIYINTYNILIKCRSGNAMEKSKFANTDFIKGQKARSANVLLSSYLFRLGLYMKTSSWNW